MTDGFKLTSGRFRVAGSLEAAIEFAYGKGWTDGLPIIPPTESRVQEMLEYAGRDPSEVIAEVPPANGEATVEKIVINAVMAGCLPAYLPVVIAAVEAMTEPEFNLHGIQATTNPVAPLAIINGPIIKELEFNCGAGCLGPGRRANATIGRAIRFILLNIGGATPGTVDKASQGQPGKYTFCVAENEDESPWEPLHVERGTDPATSTVTMFGATGTTQIATLSHHRIAEAILNVHAHSMTAMGSNQLNVEPVGGPLLLLTTGMAQIIGQAGYSKADVKQFLWEKARIPLSNFHPENIAWLRLHNNPIVDDKVLIAKRAEDILIVVAGAPDVGHSTFMASFGDTRPVTKVIASGHAKP